MSFEANDQAINRFHSVRNDPESRAFVVLYKFLLNKTKVFDARQILFKKTEAFY